MNAKPPTILMIDLSTVDAWAFKEALGDGYDVQQSIDPEAARRAIRDGDAPNLIVIDVMAPSMRGFEICRVLKRDLGTTDIPVFFTSSRMNVIEEERGLRLGAVDFLHKPYSPSLVRARVETHLRLYDNTRLLTDMITRRTKQLESTRLEIIRRLGRASEFKDDETGLHVVRMSHYCRIIAIDAGISESAADILFQAAPMHDIGKIGIPDHILQKPGPLTDEEWLVMRKHPAIGAGIIGRHDDILLDTARIVALTHHEKWNGAGYPRGLSGEEIPLTGRIVSVADVFDALTSKRPYKEAWAIERAVDYIREQAGTMFDPDIVRHFEHALPEILELRARYQEEAPVAA
ncbi:MAG: two-component system response regulator [Nevskia sp.]